MSKRVGSLNGLCTDFTVYFMVSRTGPIAMILLIVTNIVQNCNTINSIAAARPQESKKSKTLKVNLIPELDTVQLAPPCKNSEQSL